VSPAERLAVGLARSLNERWPGMAEAPDQQVLAMFGAVVMPLAEVLHDVIRDEVARQVAERVEEALSQHRET
jgi:hypothetical protein